MKSILCAAVAGALICAGGCRSDANRELLERELRDHEDEIYGLEQQCDDLHHQLEACRRENESLKKGATEPGEREVTPPRGTPMPPPPEIPTPKIDLGTPDSTPPPKTPRETPGPTSFGTRRVRPAAHFSEPPGPVERVALNHLMTGGHSFSGKPADDGLLVVFAARDAAGRPTQAAGEVSIVVIDPQISGEASRLARWDFPAPETAAHYRDGALTEAFHFELLWPNRPPEHRELKLFVRLTAPDGRRFEDNQTIHIRLPGDEPSSPAWTKAEPPQRWAPVTLPSGAQFDPTPGPAVSANFEKPAAETSRSSSESSDREPAPRAADKRPSWSPYR